MIAVDPNILVYAHRADSPHHLVASTAVESLAKGLDPWAIPWPCIHEFLAIVTHPRVYRPPSTMAQARAQVDAWLGAPQVRTIGETGEYWRVLQQLLDAGSIVGPRVHDARVAAICIANGVTELWSADRDFAGMVGLRARNPLVGPQGSVVDQSY